MHQGLPRIHGWWGNLQQLSAEPQILFLQRCNKGLVKETHLQAFPGKKRRNDIKSLTAKHHSWRSVGELLSYTPGVASYILQETQENKTFITCSDVSDLGADYMIRGWLSYRCEFTLVPSWDCVLVFMIPPQNVVLERVILARGSSSCCARARFPFPYENSFCVMSMRHDSANDCLFQILFYSSIKLTLL